MATMIDLRRHATADAREFQETRPMLYFSQHQWTHANAARRLSRWAANDPAPAQASPEPERPTPRFVDLTTAGWGEDQDEAIDAAFAAALPSPLPRREHGLLLARLAGGVALAVSALGAASHLIGG